MCRQLFNHAKDEKGRRRVDQRAGLSRFGPERRAHQGVVPEAGDRFLLSKRSWRLHLEACRCRDRCQGFAARHLRLVGGGLLCASSRALTFFTRCNDLGAHRVERLGARFVLRLDLDDVQPERRLDDIAGGSRRECECGIFERLDHLATPEGAEVAALGGSSNPPSTASPAPRSPRPPSPWRAPLRPSCAPRP